MVALKTFSLALRSGSSRSNSPDRETAKATNPHIPSMTATKMQAKLSSLLMGRSKSAMTNVASAADIKQHPADGLKITSRLPITSTGVPLTLASSLDSSYIVTLEIRLAEAVQATLFPPTSNTIMFNFKPAPSFKNATFLANMIATELKIGKTSHFLRAICRQVYKALTVLSTNLDSLFLLTSSEYSSLASIFAEQSGKPKETQAIKSAHLFAFEIAKVAWVVRSTIESAEDLLDDRVSKETLRLALDPLSATTARISNPVVNLIKQVFSNNFERISHDSSPQTLNPAISSAVCSVACGSPVSCKEIPSASYPSKLAELSRNLEIAKRLMTALALPCGPQGHTWIASCSVHIIWKAMTAYSVQRPDAINVVLNKKAVESGRATPLLHQTRSPSPALNHVSVALARSQMTGKSMKPTVITKLSESFNPTELGNALLSVEISLVEHMVLSFLQGLVETSAIQQAKPPSVVAGDGSESSSSEDDDELANLALGALKEALRALTAMVAVLPNLKVAPLVMSVLLVPFTESENKPLRRAFSALPPVILQHCIQARSSLCPVHQLLKMSWEQYLQTCIPTFAISQDWTSRIASAFKNELVKNGGTFTPPSSGSPKAESGSPEIIDTKSNSHLECNWSDVMILVLKKRGILET